MNENLNDKNEYYVVEFETKEIFTLEIFRKLTI